MTAEADHIKTMSNLFPLDFLVKKLHNPYVSANIIAFNARNCNRSCSFCYIENLPWHQSDFDRNEIDQAFSMLDNINVGLLGGEPFIDKETVDSYLYAIRKYHSIIQDCYVFSNMDYWDKYKDEFESLPKRIHIKTNSRAKKFFESTKNCDIYNGIFVDELDLNFKYPIGKYSFALKNPTYWNNITDEFHFCFDWDKVEVKLDEMYKSGCSIHFMSSMTLEDEKEKKRIFLQPELPYVNIINFPRDWKSEYEIKINACKTCKLECHKAIDEDKCPRIWKECFTCSSVNICPNFSNPRKLLDKSKLRSCNSLRKCLELGEYYRKIQKL